MIYVVKEPKLMGERLRDSDYLIVQLPNPKDVQTREGLLMMRADGKWQSIGEEVMRANSWPHFVSLLMGNLEVFNLFVGKNITVAQPRSDGGRKAKTVRGRLHAA